MADEFTKFTIRAVAMKAGLTCSHPDCRVYTGGPEENIGVAAHISARSAGGPRYDPEMSSTYRRSERNAIWLCQTCGKLIDSPVHRDRYPRPLLELWKDIAEKRASAYVGRTSPFLDSFRPAGGDYPRLLELSFVANTYELFAAIDETPDAYSTTSVARQQVAQHRTVSQVLDWAAEIIASSWEESDSELLGLCATLLSTLPDQWHPDDAVIAKLEGLCGEDMKHGDFSRIAAVEPLLFAIATKKHVNAYARFLAARIDDEAFRRAEDARGQYYYGSDVEIASAVARHLVGVLPVLASS